MSLMPTEVLSTREREDSRSPGSKEKYRALRKEYTVHAPRWLQGKAQRRPGCATLEIWLGVFTHTYAHTRDFLTL